MHLADYQRHQLKKIRRGGDFIIHGSRRIGVTEMLVYCASGYICTPDNVVYIVTKDQRDIDCTLRMIMECLSENASEFHHPPRASKRGKSYVQFENGSAIKFLRHEEPKTCDIGDPNCDLLIFDRAGEYDITPGLIVIGCATQKLLIGATGGMNKESSLYEFYINSLRGKNDAEYIRLPWELSEHLREECLPIYLSSPPEHWNRDFELHSYME